MLTPFDSKLKKAEERLAKLSGVSSRDAAMANSFPLGAGFGYKGHSQQKRDRSTDASVDKAVEYTKALREVEVLKNAIQLFKDGKINAQGRSITLKPEKIVKSRSEDVKVITKALKDFGSFGSITMPNGDKMKYGESVSNDEIELFYIYKGGKQEKILLQFWDKNKDKNIKKFLLANYNHLSNFPDNNLGECESFLESEDPRQKKYFLKFNSHRVRNRHLGSIKSYKAICSFSRGTGKGTYQVNKDDFDRLIKEKGVSSMKDGDDLFGCWSPKARKNWKD